MLKNIAPSGSNNDQRGIKMRSNILAALLIAACLPVFCPAATPAGLSVPTSRRTESRLNKLKPGRCLLVVDGKSYITGACRIEIDNGGSFQIYDLKKQGYFAYVNVSGNTAEGYWNEARGANHAHSPLGTLTRDGACWKNDRAKVCAWR